MQTVQKRTQSSRGRLGLHLFVDDVCMATSGGHDEVVERLRHAAEALQHAVRAMGCKLADPRTTVVTTHDAVVLARGAHE